MLKNKNIFNFFKIQNSFFKEKLNKMDLIKTDKDLLLFYISSDKNARDILPYAIKNKFIKTTEYILDNYPCILADIEEYFNNYIKTNDNIEIIYIILKYSKINVETHNKLFNTLCELLLYYANKFNDKQIQTIIDNLDFNKIIYNLICYNYNKSIITTVINGDVIDITSNLKYIIIGKITNPMVTKLFYYDELNIINHSEISIIIFNLLKLNECIEYDYKLLYYKFLSMFEYVLVKLIE